MKEKLRAIFDSKVTWAGIGTFAGVAFGENIAHAVNAFGIFVMAVL